MAYARPAIAAHPRLFGRGRMRDLSVPEQRYWRLSEDMKLFATTFAAGFLFVSIRIA